MKAGSEGSDTALAEAAKNGRGKGGREDERRAGSRVKTRLGSKKLAELPVSTGGAVAMGALAFYGALRGGIQVFHLSRRYFLRQLLFDLSLALDELALTYWLDFGCLLGIHRDGDLIPADNDLDVSVLIDPSAWEGLLRDLRRVLPRYSVKLVVPSEDPTARFIRVYCPLGMADVFGAAPCGGGLLKVDCGHGDTTSIREDLVLPTRKLLWRGAVLTVPHDVPGTLERRYGETWRTPRYMDKGADTIEGNKTYARVFRALSKWGIRI